MTAELLILHLKRVSVVEKPTSPAKHEHERRHVYTPVALTREVPAIFPSSEQGSFLRARKLVRRHNDVTEIIPELVHF